MNETLRTIHSLRTIHGDFSDREVPDEDLALILDASVRAANASARQSYAIVAVSDPGQIEALTGYSAAVALVFCVDYTRICDLAAELDCKFHFAEPISFVTGLVDTVLAAQTAAIAARSLGIETFFTNGIHRGDVQRVYDLLELPERGCFPAIALLLGYAAKEPKYKKGRLSGLGIVHRDRYRRLSEEEKGSLVSAYDDSETSLAMNDDWQQKGYQHYLEWFYKDWSGPIDPSQFYELLERAGFLTLSRSS